MKIVVIGSGVSGLMSAALFANDGHQVTVFEQNDEIGGVTSLAKQNGFSWEQGPLLLGDFLPSEKANLALKELGIELEVIRDCRGIEMPDYAMWRPEEYEGPDWRKDRLKKLFPDEERGIDKYYKFYEKMMRLANPVGKDTAWRKTKTLFTMLGLKKYSKMSAKDIMDHFFESDKIKALYTGILADVCVAPSEFIGLGVPFFNIETAFDKRIPLTDESGNKTSIGYGYIKGGVSKLPEALANKTIACGGKIITGAIVEKIIVEDKTVKGIKLANGEIHEADLVIASGGALEIFKDLVGLEHLDNEYRNILDTFKPMESVFMLHLGVDFNPLEFQKTALCYYYKTYDIEESIHKMRNGIYHEGDEGFLIYVPTVHSPEMAPKGMHSVTIYTVAPDTIEGKDWDKEKESYAKKLIELAEKHVPGLSEHIVEQKIMTPLDYRKLAHLKKSAFGGIVPLNGVKNPSHKTPVDGLYFVGQQSENAGGVSAVMMGAKDTYTLIKKEKGIQ